MIVVCSGTRRGASNVLIASVLKDYTSKDTIIHGDSSGVDTQVNHFCINNGINQIKMPANWEGHGHSAGPIRNYYMLKTGKLLAETENQSHLYVLAFPDQKSKGTRGMIERTYKDDKIILEIYPTEEISWL